MRDILAERESFDVVHAPEVGGWVVVDPVSLKVVEPGYLWPTRERAIAWAQGELDRLRLEAEEYRRRQDAVVEQGLAQSWAAQHPDH
jgi:hypothetical protein